MSITNVFPNRETFEHTNVLLARIAGALEGQSPVTSKTNWSEIQKNVKLGIGESAYPVGTEFTGYKAFGVTATKGGNTSGVSSVTVIPATFLSAIDTVDRKVKVFSYDRAWYYNDEPVNIADYGLTISGTPAVGDSILVTMKCAEITWVVVAHDHHTTVPASSHTMTLETKYCLGSAGGYTGVQFDAQEAFFVKLGTQRLSAGTYNFTIPTPATGMSGFGSWTPGTYQFTLPNNLNAGCQLVFSGRTNVALTSLKVYAYNCNDGVISDVADECAITAGSGGTSLGTLGDTAGTSNKPNHVHRASDGSNNYAQSAVRQLLNSENVSDTVWVSQTKYDRKPSWMRSGNYNGFLYGLGKDFKSVIKTVAVPCRTNNYYESASNDETTYAVSSTYTLNDKVFVLSRAEIYGTSGDTIFDGSILPYYNGATDAERRSFDTWGAAHPKWMRTPALSSASGVTRLNSSSGSLDITSAYNGYGVHPVVVIA